MSQTTVAAVKTVFITITGGGGGSSSSIVVAVIGIY
jgi:hypothetical protein